MIPRTVSCNNDVTMSISGPIQHLCPFVPEIDYGTVTITWQTIGATYELHSLAEYLRGFKDCEISHEAITDRICHDLAACSDIEAISVRTTWQTAGLEVSCSSTAIPVGADL